MLAKTHSNPSKKDRKAKRTPANDGRMPTLTKAYNAADELVSLVYVDIANGVARSDCIDKVSMGLYGNKPISRRQAANYYNAALDRFAIDTDIEAEKLRNLFYGRYEAILEQCIKNGDVYNARATLDSMARVFGVEQKVPTNAIQINSDRDNGVTINFGFEPNQN